ncbi:MAG: hypothetical protein LBV30_11045 [Propionibacteriaceae bacterium]|jgi:hypothetical protein|nr:hypothetical protein [Propionibacteriaceae bacterium]
MSLRGASLAQMIEVGDGLIRRQKPLVTLEHVASVVAVSRSRGVALARRALSWMRSQTDSLMETRSRLLLIGAGFPCPQVNPEVYCPDARRTYHLDLGYLTERVAVEYDGAVHVQSSQQMEIDAHRRGDLQEAGWLIFTVTRRELAAPATIIRQVRQALESRRLPGTAPPRPPRGWRHLVEPRLC